jgi:CubicO group peptidase (beta-lactamase class C family)
LFFVLVSIVGSSLSAAEPAIFKTLEPFIENGSVAGAVTLVANKDKILSIDTIGYADIGAKKPMRPDNLFWIASMSKPVTGTALMILVDEGKVKIEDPVEKYLPEFKGQMVLAEKDGNHALLKKPAHPITVREILSHTSGLPFKSPVEEPTLDMLPLRTAVRSYAAGPLQFEPSTKYQYSNAGINTAGRIIEVVSGMSYEQFLDERLFKPLGMTDTTFWPNEEQTARLAKSYTPNSDKTALRELTIGQLTYPLANRQRQPMPAGGLFSTAKDVGRFCQMVFNGGELDGKRYLSEGAVTQMTSRQTAEGIKNEYGLGWSTGGGGFGHGGAFATNMNIDPKSGLITVFLVQHSGFLGEGGKSQGVFRQKAVELFGKSEPK